MPNFLSKLKSQPEDSCATLSPHLDDKHSSAVPPRKTSGAGNGHKQSILRRFLHLDDDSQNIPPKSAFVYDSSDSDDTSNPSTEDSNRNLNCSDLNIANIGNGHGSAVEGLHRPSTLRRRSSHNLIDYFKKDSKENSKQTSQSPTLQPDVTPKRNPSELSLCEKYGKIDKHFIGKGSHGVVRIAHKPDAELGREKLFAIKEFHKKSKDGSEKSFIKKICSEFCISSSLHHENVIETVDLIQNENHQWCEVMEYCDGGDLCHLIQSKSLSYEEANAFFVQLIHGVAYIHSMGVAHRDLKPENLILDSKGCLKITDFGEAEVFQTPYSNTPHKSKRCCGSQPYMAPEEFTEREFDPRPIDIFACGVIYLAMIYSRLPWRKPCVEDPNYRKFMDGLGGFSMIDRLPPGPRTLIKSILDPDPGKRATMDQIRHNEWFHQVELDLEVRKKCIVVSS